MIEIETKQIFNWTRNESINVRWKEERDHKK